MTLLQLEEVESGDLFAHQVGPIVKCGWCGEIIWLDGKELALAMCQPCHDRMDAELHRTQRA